MRSKGEYETIWRLHEAQGAMAYSLDVFGDEIARRQGYKDSSLVGMEAVHFYLIHKFNWLPSQVRSMKAEDILFVLTEEMHGWTYPKDANFIADNK